MNSRNTLFPSGLLRRSAPAAVAASLLVALSAPVLAQDATPHRGGAHHGWRQMDPQARVDRMEYLLNRMLSRVKASDEQKAKADAVVRQAFADLRPIQEQRREGRKAVIALLASPSIDARAVEAQRAEQQKLADAASRRMTQALVDVAQILTPEQRAELAKRMSMRFGEGRGGRG